MQFINLKEVNEAYQIVSMLFIVSMSVFYLTFINRFSYGYILFGRRYILAQDYFGTDQKGVNYMKIRSI